MFKDDIKRFCYFLTKIVKVCKIDICIERRVLCTERDMERVREYIVLFFCFIAELGMAFQFIKPNYFFNSSMIIAGTNYTVARAVLLIKILGILVFAISVFRGNARGRLHRAYFIIGIHAAIMIILAITSNQYKSTLANDMLAMNTWLYFGTLLLLIIILVVYVLREKGGVRLIPNFSALLLLVIIGQFVTNGLFVNKGALISGPTYLLFGIIAAMPYVAIYVFEKFVLEPIMIQFR